MRQQSKVLVKVKNTIIGGAQPLICLPLVGEKNAVLQQEAKELIALQPDLLEWRIDAYEQVEDVDECLRALKELRATVGEIPLIFTCRIDLEGGFKKIVQKKRLELFIAVIESGMVDIIDIELCNGKEFIEAVQKRTKAKDVKLILSYHNFTETPDEAFICAKLVEAQASGGDIAKLAVMPKDYGDVLVLLSATNRARKESVQGPIITVSMGTEGVISRLAGGLFGSDITFAVGQQASAPGQIPINDLKRAMNLLYSERA